MRIKRDFYLEKLIRKRNNGMIKVITGIRRSGKSYLLDPIFKEYLLENGVPEDHIIKLELDSIENQAYTEPMALYKFVMGKVKDGEKYYILLDEIQEVANFESVLNSFLRKPNLDVYVTGSNSRFLSSDIITEFRGRGDEIRVYPLSFEEYMSVSRNDERASLGDYLMYGGLPQVAVLQNETDKRDYLNLQKDNVYLNDVVERNKIRDPQNLMTLVEIIASSVGSLTNASKLEHTFNSKGEGSITNKTIGAYLSYLEDAFLIEKARRYDVKGKHYIESPVKYYFVDYGIRNSLLNFRQYEKNHLIEGVIFMELLRRGFNVDVGVVEKRETDGEGKRVSRQLEVDFVANLGSSRFYLQSAYNIENEEKREQELRSLLNIDDSFQKFVIVYDEFPRWQDENGIIYLSIYDFLLRDGEIRGM